MDTIEVIGHVDEQHQLHVELPAGVKPGPVKVTVQPVTEEGEDDGWRALINKSWAQDWNDRARTFTPSRTGSPAMSPGEVHLANFPFGGTVGAKPRPVLLLTGPLGSVPEVLAAYMTSVIPARSCRPTS